VKDHRIAFTAAVLTTFLLAGSSHALQIDDFNGGDDSVGPGNVQSTTPYSNAIGGFRTLNYVSGNSATDSLSVGSGVLTHDDTSTAGTGSESRVVWDGNGLGLGPVDFTDGGSSNILRLNILSIGASDTLMFNILDQGSDQGDFTLTPGSAGVFDIPLSPADWGNSALSFDQVFIMDLTIEAGTGSSVVIDNIATVVPEPGTGLLMSLGLAGLGVGRSRRAQS
jgi:hypothetical protein